MFVPERMPGYDSGDMHAAVGCRRRLSRPLQRVSVPWISPGEPAILETPEEIDKGEQNSECQNESPNRDQHVDAIPTKASLVGVDSARHAEHTQQVHWEKCQVEADEHDPETDLAQLLVEHPTGHLRQPVIERC